MQVRELFLFRAHCPVRRRFQRESAESEQPGISLRSALRRESINTQTQLKGNRHARSGHPEPSEPLRIPHRDQSIRGLIIGVCCLVLVVIMVSCSAGEVEPVKVGILHSQTGAMATSEGPVIDATLMAIDEINEAGGVLGRQIEPIIVDARSDSTIAAEEDQRLIVEEQVAAIFGCWT